MASKKQINFEKFVLNWLNNIDKTFCLYWKSDFLRKLLWSSNVKI